MPPDPLAAQKHHDRDCLFCKIVDGRIPATLEHQDDECVAFQDISPQAPLHLLIIPRRHIQSVAGCTGVDRPLLGHLIEVAARLARLRGMDDSGYRLVINSGRDGGQTVPHLHVHLLGGRSLSWPPG
ncbi:MAG: histidine triad nucleotide-binding protein [Chloroflexi bacterium]|nr:histidine triad nucleotide-binding protein [Chloroflexota bacterium]